MACKIGARRQVQHLTLLIRSRILTSLLSSPLREAAPSGRWDEGIWDIHAKSEGLDELFQPDGEFRESFEDFESSLPL